MTHGTYYDALNNFKELVSKIDSFDIAVRRMLMKIKELWLKLTAFHRSSAKDFVILY
jgi:hypothetical protein